MKLRRPSPALLIACLALFISLGGVSYGVATGFIDSREIRNNTIRTQDLRNNDIRGRDIRNSTIKGRDVAFNTLTTADINESRLGKVPAAGNADSVGGLGAGAFLRPDTSGFAPLALAPGTTAAPGEATPAYDVDPLGYVHLRGSLTGTGQATLPAGARPATESHFVAAAVGGGGVVQLDIATNGAITIPGMPSEVSLDGITFKAGG